MNRKDFLKVKYKMTKDYSTEYWKQYYKNLNYTKPSDFSKFCLKYIKSNENILDICCGDGRDSTFFKENNIDTYGFDINSLENTNFNYKEYNLNENQKNFGYDIQFDNVYCRFTLHAVTEDLEDYILINSNNILKENGFLFIEVRSDKGEIKESINDHYRRLINLDELKNKLLNINFEIEYIIEEDNLSVTEKENPVLIRIVVRKKENIKVNSDIPFREFHNIAGKINFESAEHLLLTTKKILDRNNIDFYVVFGTLLGIYRDNNFIEHDEDVDVAIFFNDVSKIEKLIDEGQFAIYGLKCVRNDKTFILSFQYKKDYIDFYFFKDLVTYYQCSNYKIDKNELLIPSQINFLNHKFKTVQNIENYLIGRYGEDWRTPIKGKHAQQ